ncbi:restriction endonuclease subunit S [Enterobacter hormaechei]|nr:restriction endonuclease subunit S [Enterobacter hormaechei]MBM6490219.1 restriction endonuclease subunit S [Enterobacter hormaechei]WDC54711.1 restriction endonuclease subunit S [Enterobacter hormaechei]HDU8956144.1 restriction endonuclease subunit S [Enterobacter hormaechei]
MVPKGWKIVTLKDLLDGQIKNGYSPNATDSETGYWVLSLGALADEGINSSGIKPVLPEEKVLQNLLKKDDFLVSRSNTPDKVGRSIRFKNEIENCSYPDLMMRFRIDDTKADKEFIEQQLKSSTVRAYFKNCAAGSSSTMVKINKGILEKTPIVVPPIKEQKKIAQVLFAWDKAIVATEKLLTNSQLQKKAMMQKLLTGKKRLLDERGVRYGGEWHRAELGAVLDYMQPTPYLVDSTDYNDSYSIPVLTAGKSFILGYTNEEHGIYHAPLPAIIFDDFTTDSKFVDFEFKAKSSAMKILTAKKGVSAKYIFEAMQMLKFKIGGHQRHWISIYSNLVIPIPDAKEQQKIASALSTADAEISTLEKKLACLKEEKKALMQQLLTGKRRVKMDEAVAA